MTSRLTSSKLPAMRRLVGKRAADPSRHAWGIMFLGLSLLASCASPRECWHTASCPPPDAGDAGSATSETADATTPADPSVTETNEALPEWAREAGVDPRDGATDPGDPGSETGGIRVVAEEAGVTLETTDGTEPTDDADGVSGRCIDNFDCDAPFPVCHDGRCIQCIDDERDFGCLSTAAPRCKSGPTLDANRCVQCLSGLDCGGETPACQENQCVPCTIADASGCGPEAPYCLAGDPISTNQCVQCFQDADCGDEFLLCQEHACVPCRGAHCGYSVVSFSVGYASVCAILEDSSLWCWGANGSGQLGSGSRETEASTPRAVEGELGWSSVSVGYYHACGVKNGALYCWGNNVSGELGLGEASTGTERLTPDRVGTASDWVDVSAGSDHTCGIRGAGTLYCWGWDPVTEQGRGTPTRVGTETGWSAVSVGSGGFACALQQGSPYCWGTNPVLSGVPVIVPDQPNPIPAPVRLDAGSDWSTIIAGNLSACGVKSNGQLYCWGDRSGIPDLGLPESTPSNRPSRVGQWEDWLGFDLAGHSCGLRASGQIWCFGRNDYGERGEALLGTHTYALIRAFDDDGWTDVQTGELFSCGLKAGSVYCWGTHERGQLGVGEQLVQRANTPARVGTSNAWTHVSAGGILTCGLQGANAYCWGGRGVVNYPGEPTTIVDAGYWSDLSVGRFSVVAKRGTQLWSWGVHPLGGYLVLDPQRIGDLDGWHSASISASSDNAICALRDGRLHCYGRSLVGQLGLGAIETSNTLAQVGMQSDWTSVSAGDSHTCGLRNLTLNCWGSNSQGQLGLGSPSEIPRVNTPQQVGSTLGWTSVSAGAMHTCGTLGGHLHCWGREREVDGVLGLGAVAPGIYPEPTRVGSDILWNTVSAGSLHNCALRQNELYCWGNDRSGRVGIGQPFPGAAVSSPQRVSTSSDWTQVSAGHDHTCALKNDGTLWCWGSNSHGQLGVGPSWSESPLRVLWQ